MTTNTMIWIDLETTGLTPENDCILEIGARATDASGNEISRFDSLVWTPGWREALLKTESQAASTMHASSGLIDELLLTPEEGRAYLLPQAVEKSFWRWLAMHVNPGTPICGSSVHFDREFLRWHMKGIYDYFGYRIVDVSSTAEQLRIARPDLYAMIPERVKAHRPQADLDVSIGLWQWFLDRAFLVWS